jgi:hypothetical protein
METFRALVLTEFDVVGFHHYPDAPNKVDFLKHKHRHIFTIKMGYNVKDLDRELEIFIMQDYVKDYLYETYGSPCLFENMSCEMIAKEILEFSIPDGVKFVEVLEDGKGGARVEI